MIYASIFYSRFFTNRVIRGLMIDVHKYVVSRSIKEIRLDVYEDI